MKVEKENKNVKSPSQISECMVLLCHSASTVLVSSDCHRHSQIMQKRESQYLNVELN